MPVIINGSTGLSGTDGSAATPAVQGTDTNTGMFFPAADQIAFAEGGVEAMRLDASGNVMVGTTTPVASNRLTVVGGGVQFSPGTAAQPGVRIQQSSGVCSFTGINNDNNTFNNIAFFTGASETARFTTTGALVVGTTTNASYTADRIQFNSGSYFVLNQSSVGVVLTSGNTSWSAQSDERLKDIIEPIENAASKVASLRPIIGRYKTDEPTKRRAFLIAQDVQAVLPEAVTEDDQGYLLLAYTELVPLLTAALQEALTEIASLKARVTALETTP